jgi:hypothetical protein
MLTVGFAELTGANTAGITTAADGTRMVDWATRLPAIGGQAVFSGLVSEIMGGEFSQGFAQSLASQLGREVMGAINTELRAGNLSAQEQAAYNLMGRSISAALTIAANPDNPLQALALGFIGEMGAALGGEIGNLNAGSTSRIAFDDEGHLMPGIVNPNATEAQQRSQIYNQLRVQGLSPAEANRLMQQWMNSGGQAAFNAAVAAGAGAGTGSGTAPTTGANTGTGSTTGVTNRVAFDDEGYLMPGIVDPNATPLEQAEQLMAQLRLQGLTESEAYSLTSDFLQDIVSVAAPTLQQSSVESTNWSPEEIAARVARVEQDLAYELAAQQARDESLLDPDELALLTGGGNSSRTGTPIQPVLNGNFDAALNAAADLTGTLQIMGELRGALGQLQAAQIEGKIENLRATVRAASVTNIPSDYERAWIQGGAMVPDYAATVNRLEGIYNDHLRNQRMTESWGSNWRDARIRRSQ